MRFRSIKTMCTEYSLFSWRQGSQFPLSVTDAGLLTSMKSLHMLWTADSQNQNAEIQYTGSNTSSPRQKRPFERTAAENSVMFLPGRLSQFGSEKLGEIKVPLSQSCSTQAVITLATGCQCCDGLYPCQAHLYKENICGNFTHTQTVKNYGENGHWSER